MQTYNIIIDANKKETTRHGGYEFPLALYHTRICKNILGFIDWHWHEELQLSVVLQGRVEFQVNEDVLILNAGEGLFVNKGQLHRSANYQHSDSTYICVDFQANLVAGFEGSVIGRKYVQPYLENAALPYLVLNNTEPWQNAILEQIKILGRLFENKAPYYEWEMTIILQQIWLELVKNSFASRALPAEAVTKPTCKQIIGFIRQHYMEKVNLADLAQLVSMSESACCREFKRAMKCTIFEYLMNYRLSESARLLLTTEASITEIAYQCGFSSASYFIDQFKKKTDTTPLAYRKDKVEHKEGILSAMEKK